MGGEGRTSQRRERADLNKNNESCSAEELHSCSAPAGNEALHPLGGSSIAFWDRSYYSYSSADESEDDHILTQYFCFLI